MKQNYNKGEFITMKKLISILTLVCLTVLSLCGCSLFEKPSTQETVVIKYVDTEDTFVFDTGHNMNKINLLYTEGKILIGIYDTKDDSGEKYFDYDGRFIQGGMWSASYPHTLYAVYEDLDPARIYTSYIKNNESPELIIYYVYGYRTVCKFYNFSESGMTSKRQDNQLTANDKYFAALIQSNPKLKVQLTMRFEGKYKGTHTDQQFRYQIKIGQESFDEHIGTIPLEWKEFSASIEIAAKQLSAKQGEIYFLAVPKNGNYGANEGILIKNVYFELSLLPS